VKIQVVGGPRPDVESKFAQIWRQVKSMVMETVDTDPAAELIFHERYSTVDDIHKLSLAHPMYIGGDHQAKLKLSRIMCSLVCWRLEHLQIIRGSNRSDRRSGPNTTSQ
jgi:hypothetical protein